ncbi:unnamed protein product [Kuraishia capsulata CBS 1993]|uniref:CMP/dCMP-type deaminase domain-containing protein n=1 Tax=Kuraishia capsulata CBS 1993 TaxID=1382522 RepID=W6MXW6_9ASCO|nr:uncharacterized protein KUCA_T00005593001 [Kuraishia capsulata CBS 1993]CDK29600.1 unnamed protein product [Kuraishia capsulata CBS 1993]
MGTKRQKTAHHTINYETLTFDEVLRNVRSLEGPPGEGLIHAWIAEVPASESAKVLSAIREGVDDTVDLKHLKRFVKTANGTLRTLVCSVDHMKRPQLEELLRSVTILNITEELVPGIYPTTKEVSLELSAKYWPISWKGNPLVQELNELKVDVPAVKKNLEYIAKIAKETTGKQLPIVTMMVDSRDPQRRVVSVDSRETNQLAHSVMRCIQEVADHEVERRKLGEERDYLCFGYDVYTTHEPCAMCSMALVHSRVSNLYYVNQSPVTGAIDPQSGSGYCIHRALTLNWKFEAWHWLEELDVDKIAPDVFV